MGKGNNRFHHRKGGKLEANNSKTHAQQVARSLLKTGLRLSEPFHGVDSSRVECAAEAQINAFNGFFQNNCRISIRKIAGQILADHISGQLQRIRTQIKGLYRPFRRGIPNVSVYVG